MNQLPFKILGIEHIGIAKRNLDDVYDLFSNILGLQYSSREEVEDQEVITDIYYAGNNKIEFLQPTKSTSPIEKYINKKGDGIHHIALLIDNLQSALNYLNNKGIQIIDHKPRVGAKGLQIAFLHPKSTGGILIELCQKK